MLVGAAVALGARKLGPLSAREQALVGRAGPISRTLKQSLKEMILSGQDPLGDARQELLQPERRRRRGAVYTPPSIVSRLVGWGAKAGVPSRVVDPGTGSGRFLMAAFHTFGSEVPLVGVEIDPVAALIARANLATVGAQRKRVTILNEDFCRAGIQPLERTLWVGNPPYVRHQRLPQATKRWLTKGGRSLGLQASIVMGLHGYFVLRIATLSAGGDRGALLLPAEWLDAHYGSSIERAFLEHLGAIAVTVLDRQRTIYGETRASSAVVFFNRDGDSSTISFRRVSEPDDLAEPMAGSSVIAPRDDVGKATRWSRFLRPQVEIAQPRLIALHEVADVRRGIATGHNEFFVRAVDDAEFANLGSRYLVPVVSRARELTAEREELIATDTLKRLLVLPADVAKVRQRDRDRVKALLRRGVKMGVPSRYLCAERAAWHAVPLPARPPDILATYMGRDGTRFVHNVAGAFSLNIAHGIFVRDAMSDAELLALLRFLKLTARSNMWRGREYSTGLIKMEPTELGRTLVPDRDALAALALLVSDEAAFRQAISALASTKPRSVKR